MTRFIEIFTDDDIQLLTTDELPFVVSVDIETHNIINICKVHEFEKLTQVIQCAYLAEDDGHLFFQPDLTSSDQQEIKIFHNDELIEKSVWIKSDDIITIENKIIIFKISGDKIELRIIDRKDTKVLSPPPIEELIIIKPNGNPEDNNNELPEISKDDKEKLASKKSTRNMIIMLLIILTTIASFILIAETVNLVIKPEAQEVELNGLIPAIKLGHRYIVVSGKYQLTAVKKGYKPLNETIEIDEKNNFFSYQMQETPGLVQFDVLPKKNNRIFLNDVLLGNAYDGKNKAIEYEVDKGEYQLKIVNPRYKIYEQHIRVEGKNKSQLFSTELKPNWGLVEINSKPENSLIEIKAVTNDESKIKSEILKSRTPDLIELISGKYELSISKEKYKSKQMIISIQAEEKVKLDKITLQAEDAQLILNSKPNGGLVRVDGQYYGKTPVTITLSPFVEHEIEISLSGYGNQKQTLKLEPEVIKKMDFKLIKNTGSVFISSSPKQAKLYINGKLQMLSSGKYYLDGKDNTITVKAKGYKTQTKNVDATSYTKNISFVLEKIPSTKKSEKKKKARETQTQNKSKKSYVNSIGQKMILMQPSVFTMGSAKNEIGRRSNEPEHQVKLTQAFYLSNKEISNKQFKKFKAAHNSGFSSGQSLGMAEQPVVNISWNEAAKFANWLSKKEGLKPYYNEQNGKMIPKNLSTRTDGYRLPFEAEWEYAARGQNKQKYSWIGTYPPKIMAGNFADEAARKQVSQVIDGYQDQHSVSAPVGSYNANQFGFYDMGGNVSEWCQDNYVPYSTSHQFDTDPVGPEKGTHKVVRDSSWRDSSITELRLSYRGYSKKAMNDIGFRIARSAL